MPTLPTLLFFNKQGYGPLPKYLCCELQPIRCRHMRS